MLPTRLIPVVLALALGAAACSESAEPRPQAVAGAAESTCGDLPGTPQGVRMPVGLPTPEGATLFQGGKIGKSRAFQLRHAGGASELGVLRDKATAALTAAGYTVKDPKDGPGQSASARFTGKQSGILSVVPLCRGQLALRFQIDPAAASASASPSR